LRATNKIRLAIVGAGGKTTSLFRLAKEHSTNVLVSTSTHLGEQQAGYADRHIILTQSRILKRAEVFGVTLITGPINSEKRLTGLNDEQLLNLYQIANELDIPLLIEADGSRNLSLKAPSEHEPNIPEWVNSVMVCAGISVIGKRLGVDTVHRAEIFSSLTGLDLGDIITTESVQSLFLHDKGGLKGIPQNARKIALFNKADTTELQSIGVEIGQKLLIKYHSALITSLHNPFSEDVEKVHRICERTAGIILAAGGASRYGSPKILVEWCGKPIIYHIVKKAVDSGLSPIVVVLGSVIDPIISILQEFPIQIVINQDWSSGQGSSVRAGISSLPSEIGAAIFLLADQPQIPVDLIRGIINTHNITLDPLIIPCVNNKQANPVLFDRDVFSDLRNIEGDQGGRAIFENYPITRYPWSDENILLDIDTPEDFIKLLALK
jgi:molybdenum cofactor cytidylyltransferase